MHMSVDWIIGLWREEVMFALSEFEEQNAVLPFFLEFSRAAPLSGTPLTTAFWI